MILIVSYGDDPHAALVRKAVQDTGCADCAILDLESALENTQYGYSPSEWQFDFGYPVIRIDSNNCHSVWWRRAGKFPVPSFRQAEGRIAYAESYWTVRWLIEALPISSFPLGHPRRLRGGENKLRQLQVARHVGFSLPETCVSNDRDRLIEFARRFDSVILKPLYVGSRLSEADVENPLQTSVVDCSQFIDSLLALPGPECLFLQSRVRKTLDVRTLVLPGDRHWSFEIDTSHYDQDSVDWRIDSMNLQHTPIPTPAGILEQSIAFLKAMQLTSGSFDFGVTETGEWVFFECNPNGQWLWLELKTGVEIARQFAAILLEHHEQNRAHSRDARTRRGR